MAFEDNIVQLRREKLKQIEALGQQVYPTKYEFTHTIPQVWRNSAGQARRAIGESSDQRSRRRTHHGHPPDGQGRLRPPAAGRTELQIYVKKDAVGEKALSSTNFSTSATTSASTDISFRTRTGELSVHVEEITFLSKDFLPLPEKWHGLTDVETALSPALCGPGDESRSPEVFLKRSSWCNRFAAFWTPRFIEVETPMMQPIAGGAAARPVHHSSQHAGSRSFPAHRAGALSQAAGRWRAGSGVRDQPQLPQ